MDNEELSTETQISRKSSKKITISDAITLFLISATAYGFLYISENEYFKYFGIPTTFMNFDIQELIPLIKEVILILLAYIFYSVVLSVFLSSLSKKLVTFAIFLVLFGPFFILVTLYNWRDWITLLSLLAAGILTAIFIFSENILRVILRKRRGTNQNRIVEQKIPIINNTNKVVKLAIETIGIRTAFLIIFIILLYYLALNYGKFTAINATSFLVAKTTPECAVLYSTSDRVICFPFDRTSHEVEPAFRVIYFQDNQNIEFRNEHIGPLHIKPTPTITPIPTNTPIVLPTPLPTQIGPATRLP